MRSAEASKEIWGHAPPHFLCFVAFEVGLEAIFTPLALPCTVFLRSDAMFGKSAGLNDG